MIRIDRIRVCIAAVLCALMITGLIQRPAHAGDETSKPAAAENWSAVEELWYILEMAGGKAGWMCNLVEQNGSAYRTTNTTYMKIDRGAVSVEIEMLSAFTETLDGKPVSIDMSTTTGKQPVRTKWEFTPEHIVVETTQGARTTKRTASLPEGQWLTPMAAERYARAQREAGVKEYSFRTLTPQTSPSPITITSTLLESGEHEVNGKMVPVTIWESKSDFMKELVTLEKFDAEGRLVYQEVPLMGLGKVKTVLATKEQAKAEGGPLPEILFSTVIKPDKPIDNHLKATRAKLRLRSKSGALPEIPAAGSQRVEMSEDRKSAVLNIDINDPLPALESEATNPEFTEASSTVDSDDDMVKKLAKPAGSQATDQAQDESMIRADALRKKVNKHISRKGMATAFATASETARTRTGDCSEHGVLLCALLRAQGIPARVATGLVYADAFAGAEGIFGWHMWTQALIDGEWVDLDATLPVRYNAAHVLTATSSLADGLTGNEMMSVMQLIGNLEIEVLEVQYD